MAHHFTRQELYGLVWSEPMSTLGPTLGISGVGLAKVCRRADIPVPERGYWARLHAGKDVARRSLPPRGPGMSDTVVIGETPYEPYAALAARLLAGPSPPPPTFSEEMTHVTERVRAMVSKVRVTKTLDRPHPLIARLLDEEERRRERQTNSSLTLSSDGPLFGSPFERRRLRIVNGVFLALQRCGCRPWLRDRQAREIGVEVGQQHVAFSVDRVGQRGHTPHPGLRGTAKAVGREKMRLTISTTGSAPATGTSWEDTDTTRIEDHLSEIVVALMVAGEAHYRAGALAAYEWRLQRRAELEDEMRRRREAEERRERERLAALERERLERLFNAANAWRRAVDLRAFVDAVRAANQGRSGAAAKRLERWAADALSAADRLDPLHAGELHFEDAEPRQPRE